jgi:MtaA/CmuA family methyltransferase
MNGRERILAMIEGREVDQLPFMPITMMFAADLIGVPYREYATDYRVLVEGQIQTARKFGIDYVSCISDPAREACDLGARVEIFENQPPAIVESEALLSNQSLLAGLKFPDLHREGRMNDRVKAAGLFKQRVGEEKLVEGWVEGPCAMAADLRGINHLMMDFYDEPAFVKELFEFVVRMEIQFARAQVEAGVDLIGVGDAAASLVGPTIYQEFVLPFEKTLVDALHTLGTRVRLHICGNTRRILRGMGETNSEIVDLDYPSPLDEGRAQMGERQVLLGNIHPVNVLRNGSPEGVRQAVAECHRGAGSHFIVGAGCEVPRGTPPENLMAMAEYARTHKPADY